MSRRLDRYAASNANFVRRGGAPWLVALAATLMFCAVSVKPATAAEWFVAPQGTGSGSASAPFGRIQEGLEAARPGDIVTVRAGTYHEALRTIRSGVAGAPIVVRAEPGGHPVIVTVHGTVFQVDHAHVVIESLVFDAQYANAVAVDVNSGGNFLVLRDVEVRRSGRDCIDLAAPERVLVEGSLIHHCLYPANGGSDAHGISAGAVRELTIRDTEIHTFSGDGIQVDPTRNPAGWDRVTIEGCRIWLAPLAQAENGFAAGRVPGENAIDTKTPTTGPRARLVVRDVLAWGFRGAIENQAAFNLKENIDATVDGVTVWDSEIAFRLRGPTTRPGAWVALQNSVIYNVATAVRYEDNIENLRVWNNTFGLNVARLFQAASSRMTGLDVRNLLLLAPRLPAEAVDRSNRTADLASFVDAPARNYRLAPGSPAIDAATPIVGVTTDRDGLPRPQGDASDVGAYEWSSPVIVEQPVDVFGPRHKQSPQRPATR